MANINYAQIEAIEMKRMSKLQECNIADNSEEEGKAFAWNECLNWVISLLNIDIETNKIHHEIVKRQNKQHDLTVKYTKKEVQND